MNKNPSMKKLLTEWRLFTESKEAWAGRHQIQKAYWVIGLHSLLEAANGGPSAMLDALKQIGQQVLVIAPENAEAFGGNWQSDWDAAPQKGLDDVKNLLTKRTPRKIISYLKATIDETPGFSKYQRSLYPILDNPELEKLLKVAIEKEGADTPSVRAAQDKEDYYNNLHRFD